MFNRVHGFNAIEIMCLRQAQAFVEETSFPRPCLRRRSGTEMRSENVPSTGSGTEMRSENVPSTGSGTV